ncbi:MAG: hypothetical protein GY763_00870 [Gammaproteobacteria bacterium]|nr:hypothetical protein [Gammaproteobacteria bacterium]
MQSSPSHGIGSPWQGFLWAVSYLSRLCAGYLQTKTIWIDALGETANPFVIR